MTNQLYENMKLPLFLYLHTLPFDKLPLPLDGKKTKFSPMHQTWPSLALSFSLLWELTSLSISSKSLPQLPSPPSLWLPTGERAGLQTSHCPTHFRRRVLGPQKSSSLLAMPCGHTIWWGPRHSLYPQLHPLHGSFIPSCVKAHLSALSLYGSSWLEADTGFMF